MTFIDIDDTWYGSTLVISNDVRPHDQEARRLASPRVRRSAYALFTFPSLADDEEYRVKATTDPECIDAYRLTQESGCIRRYEGPFLAPVRLGPRCQGVSARPARAHSSAAAGHSK